MVDAARACEGLAVRSALREQRVRVANERFGRVRRDSGWVLLACLLEPHRGKDFGNNPCLLAMVRVMYSSWTIAIACMK